MKTKKLFRFKCFLLSGIISLLMVPVLSHGAEIRAASSDFVPLWGPYITGTEGMDVIVNWKTAVPSKGIVQYTAEKGCSASGIFTEFVVSESTQELHHVRISELIPGMRYCYRVWDLDSEVAIDSIPDTDNSRLQQWLTDNGIPTSVFQFTGPGSESFTFIVYGDSQEQAAWFSQMDRHHLVAEKIAEENPDFVVHLGDFIHDADDLEGWDSFFEAGRNMLANTVLYPVMGNHENYSPVYFQNFGLPPYYRFTTGGAGFTVLDTNYKADYEAQAQSLKNELINRKNSEFVFFHHPAYTTDDRNYGGWQQPRIYWEDTFVEHEITAVFSGHVHAYERFLIRGIHYLVAGTGGGMLTELSADVPQVSLARLEKTLGYIRVNVEEDVAAVDFIRVARISDDNRDILEIYPYGSVFDAFTIQNRLLEQDSAQNNTILLVVIITVIAVNLCGIAGYLYYRNRLNKSKVTVKNETGY